MRSFLGIKLPFSLVDTSHLVENEKSESSIGITSLSPNNPHNRQSLTVRSPKIELDFLESPQKDAPRRGLEYDLWKCFSDTATLSLHSFHKINACLCTSLKHQITVQQHD